jgi:N utilization substance protein B
MLYRRHLRIKVLQSLYAYFITGSDDPGKGEKQLLLSVNKLYELFIYQLSFLVEVNRFAVSRMEENKTKFYPTKSDLNPNLKFINNRVNALLEANKDFLKKEEVYKVNWADQQNMVRKFYVNLTESDFFKKYMDKSETSLEEDKLLYIKIVDQMLTDEDLLKDFYEGLSVYFSDGYDLVLLMLIKFFETLSASFTAESPLPGLYKNNNKNENEDLEFLKKLYQKTILRDEANTEILKTKTSNWDYERVPLMDIILLKMAIIELLDMETVPVKVTLNEYIELAKYFSTPKSKTFVNGVLDRLIREFKEEGKIKKMGRGLVD